MAHSEKREHRKLSGVACSPTGWEHVVGARAIVAKHFSRAISQEQSAIRLQSCRQSLRIFDRKLQMLGRDRVRQLQDFRLFMAQDRTAVSQCEARRLGG